LYKVPKHIKLPHYVRRNSSGYLRDRAREEEPEGAFGVLDSSVS